MCSRLVNMNEKREKSISKSLSFWLRHKPEDIGITIQKNGWTSVSELIEKASDKFPMTFDEIQYVVENQNPEKRRLTLSEDLSEIKANQGHSIEVVLEFDEVVPPQILYHGAPVGVIETIMKEGLKKMNRHHVHLSPDEETAAIVGGRRGKFEILEIEAMRLRADGHKIYMSENGVYLVDEVPVKYIKRNGKR